MKVLELFYLRPEEGYETSYSEKFKNINHMFIRKVLNIIVVSFIVINVSVSFNTSSLNDSLTKAKQLLYEGSIMDSAASVKKGYEILKNLYQQNQSRIVLYYVAQAEYELVRLGVTDKKNKLYEQYIDPALDKIDKLQEQYPNWSEVYALSSALHGYRIAYNPLNAFSAGPKSYYAAEEAVKLDSLNPRAWLVKGIVRLNMPSAFGGSISEAIMNFKKAISLFEQKSESDLIEPEWGFIDTYVWLGWAYEKKKSYSDAEESYRKAVALEPKAIWVKKFFLDRLLQETNANE